MKIVKNVLLLIVAAFMTLMSFSGIIGLITILCQEDFKEGKIVTVIILLLLIVGCWIIAVKCYKIVFEKGKEKESRIEKNFTQSEKVISMGKGATQQTVNKIQQMNDAIQGREVPAKNGSDFNYKYPKCNCDGCPKQEECEYGHTIYDEVTNERMTLVDKFMMLHALDGFECANDNNFNIATNEELHDKRLLLKLDEDTLGNTLHYLQNQKKQYIALGKCGRAYFNFMKIGDEIVLVKEAINEYNNNSMEQMEKLDLHNYVDVQQEYDFVMKHTQYSTIPHDNVPFSKEEEIFFKTLIRSMKENKLWNKEGLILTRLSNYTFNVNCHTCYIGKVNLRGKMYIQVLRGANQIKVYDCIDLKECIEKIPAWIRYIKYCRRN